MTRHPGLRWFVLCAALIGFSAQSRELIASKEALVLPSNSPPDAVMLRQDIDRCRQSSYASCRRLATILLPPLTDGAADAVSAMIDANTLAELRAALMTFEVLRPLVRAAPETIVRLPTKLAFRRALLLEYASVCGDQCSTAGFGDVLTEPVFVEQLLRVNGEFLALVPAQFRTRALALIAVRSRGLAWRHLTLPGFPAHLNEDAELLRVALASNGHVYSLLPSAQQEDAVIAELALRTAPDVYARLPITLRSNPDLALLALRDAAMLDALPASLGEDLAFLREALRRNGALYAKLPLARRGEVTLLLAALRNHPAAYESAPLALQRDDSLALQAVTANGEVFRFLAPEWRDDAKLARAALLSSQSALAALGPKLRNDTAFMASVFADSSIRIDRIPETWLSDEALIDALLSARPALIASLPPALRSNERITRVLPRYPEALQFASADFSLDAATARGLVETSPAVYRWLPRDVRNDLDLVALAISRAPENLQYAGDDVLGNAPFLREQVARNQRLYRYLPADLVDDEALLRAVLGKWKGAIQFASERLRGRADLVLPLLEQEPWLFQYAAPVLRTDAAFVVAALKANARVYAALSEQQREDPRFIKLALAGRWLPAVKDFPAAAMTPELALRFVKDNASNWSNLPTVLTTDKAFVLRALAVNSAILQYLPERADKRFVEPWLKKNPAMLGLVDPVLRADRELVRRLLVIDPTVLQYAADALRDDDELARLALSSNPVTFQSLSPRLQKKYGVGSTDAEPASNSDWKLGAPLSFRLTPKPNAALLTFALDHAALRGAQAVSIAAVGNQLWVGTSVGLLWLDSKTGAAKLWGAAQGLPGDFVFSVAASESEVLISAYHRKEDIERASHWYGDQGTFLIDLQHGYRLRLVQAGGERVLRQCGRYLAMSGRNVLALDAARGTTRPITLPSSPVYQRMEYPAIGADGLLFPAAGALNRERHRYQGGQLIALKADDTLMEVLSAEAGLPNDAIWAVAGDRDAYWFLHYEEDDGLTRFDRATRKAVLMRKSVNGVRLGGGRLVKDGTVLWIGQRYGVVRYDIVSGQATLFDSGQGMPELSVGGMVLADNKLWATVYTLKTGNLPTTSAIVGFERGAAGRGSGGVK